MMELSAVSSNVASTFVSNSYETDSGVTVDHNEFDSPAATVELSDEGLAALDSSSSALYSVNTTIKESIHYLTDAMDKTRQFYNNYDISTDDDIYVQGRDIKNIIDTMWQKNTGLNNYSPSDWAQHGKVINGRRTVTEGPSDVQATLTSLFNDLDFTTKKGINKSYSIMKSAYNAMRTSI